jgi:hypothetical protein
MDPDTPAPPPEARLIQIARKAAGLTADAAAKSTGGTVSPVYWRDVERGYGYRRSKRVPARASDRVLAHMAQAVRVTPERLAEAGRPDAAAVLREIHLADSPPPPLVPFPAAARPAKEAIAEEILADLLDRYGDREVVRVIGARGDVYAGTRVVEILRFLKSPELDREVLAALLAARLDRSDDEVVQALGRQDGKREVTRAAEIFEWLGWHPPEMHHADNGTTGWH